MNRLLFRMNLARFSAKTSHEKIAKYIDSLAIPRSGAAEFISSGNLRISAISLEPVPYASVEDFIDDMADYLTDAAKNGAHMVVFPMYTGLLPILSLSGIQQVTQELHLSFIEGMEEGISVLREFFDDTLDAAFSCYYHTFSILAARFGIYLCAGTTLLPTPDGYLHRGYLFDPQGHAVLQQDKIHLSPWEKALGVSPGQTIDFAETSVGKISLLAGEDSFYYETYKIAKNLGSQIVLAPSCQLFVRDAYRESAVLMRTQECPVFAVQSVMNGQLFGCDFYGSSGIYGPYDLVRSRDGILCSSGEQKRCCVDARLNLDKLSSWVDLYSSDVNEQFYVKFVNSIDPLPVPILAHEPAPFEETPELGLEPEPAPTLPEPQETDTEDSLPEKNEDSLQTDSAMTQLADQVAHQLEELVK